MLDVVVSLVKPWLTSDMKWYNENAHSIPNEEKTPFRKSQKKISQSQHRRQNCVFTLIQPYLIHLISVRSFVSPAFALSFRFGYGKNVCGKTFNRTKQ